MLRHGASCKDVLRSYDMLFFSDVVCMFAMYVCYVCMYVIYVCMLWLCMLCMYAMYVCILCVLCVMRCMCQLHDQHPIAIEASTSVEEAIKVRKRGDAECDMSCACAIRHAAWIVWHVHDHVRMDVA